MSMHSIWRYSLGLLALGLAVLAGLLTPGSASAHERRAIANNQAEVVVGWIVEPAFVDEPNGVDFRVTNPVTKAPIEGLEKTIQVEVIQGATKRTFALRARFGQPGAYTADLIPTVTGDYSFRFVGEINGVKIDEKFDSGPNRFDGIKPQASVQFPAAQPSTGELLASLAEARGAAESARQLAMIGLAAGVVGLLVGGAAILMRSRGGARRSA